MKIINQTKRLSHCKLRSYSVSKIKNFHETRSKSETISGLWTKSFSGSYSYSGARVTGYTVIKERSKK